MISAFRRMIDTWVAKAFFVVMAVAFVSWGVGDVIRNIGTTTWAAKVGGQTIEGQELQQAYQRQMAQVTRNLPQGQEATPEMRASAAHDVLQQLIAQAALAQELARLHIVTPDAAVRQTVFAMPGFRGSNGQFDRNTFETVLRNNGLSEPRFLDMMRADLSQRQLLEAVSAGAAAPETMLRPVFDARFEKRSADMVEFPFAAAAEPPAPSDAELHRWYDNHPDAYSTPELRRIKAVVLSPETLAKQITISDADLHAAYDQHQAEYVKPAKRSVEVISIGDEAKARDLANQWHANGDWTAMQKAVQAAGGTAIELSDAAERELPDPGLGKAVFAAAQDAVSEPVKGALGWYVIKVTKATPGSEKSFDEVKDELRKQVLAGKAADLMYDRANKVDNILGTGAGLDQMPDDLGLVGIAGSMDAQGNTPEGTPAPIPGPPELKAAMIKAAFDEQKGDPPRLVEVPTPSNGGSAYYALSVEDVIPPAVKPYDQVKQQVQDDWTRDARRRVEEQQAAALLAKVKGGQSLADAATVAGVAVRRTPLVTRDSNTEGMPAELQRVLFGLKQGEPTMVETAEGFIVAVCAEIIDPDPKADPAGYSQVREVLARSIGGDLARVFTDALRERAQPRINKQVVDNISGQ